jgi:hypothetical protein
MSDVYNPPGHSLKESVARLRKFAPQRRKEEKKKEEKKSRSEPTIK